MKSMDHVEGADGRLCGSVAPGRQHSTPTPFELGFQIYNKTFKKRSSSNLVSNDHHRPCTIDDLLKEVVEISTVTSQRRSKAQTKLENALTAINQHAQVIDVLIQQQPDITAIVWGAIRFLIGVAAREIETTERIADALLEIFNDLGRWEKYVEIFKKSDRVHNRAAHLFSQIIRFLVRAKSHYQSHRAIRYVRVSLTTYAHKFEENMRIIRTEADSLEREATLAAEMEQDLERKSQAQHRALELDEFMKQARFQEKTSVRLRNALSEVQETSDILRKEAFAKDLDATFKWLQQWPFSPRSMPYIEEGTCSWVRQHQAFLRWSEALHNKPLCIHGAPGCGKTAIASNLVHFFETTTRSVTIPHFFQNVTNRDQSRTTPFVAALLTEFLQREEAKLSKQYHMIIDQLTLLSASYKTMGERFSFQSLWTVLWDLSKCFADFTLIVDGLDECDESSRADLCSELIKLASQPNARVIVLFRHHSALEKSFEDSFKIEITPIETNQDITLYVAKETQRCPRLQRHKHKITEKVPEICKGIFLMAKILLECLRSAPTYRQQLDYLEHYPTGIGHYYKELLSQRTIPLAEDSLLRRREIFLLLLQVRKAPSCEELSVVLALKEDSDRLDEEDRLIDPEKEVLKLCSPLVRVSNNHVSLVHESVAGFLVHSGSGANSSIHVSKDDSDTYLAQKCLLALSQEEYRSSSKIAILIRQNVALIANEDEDKYFYQYAATHWFIHMFALTKPAISLVELLARFLGGNEFVSWSEFVLQLRKSQGTMLEVGGKLRQWTKNLSSNIQDYLSLAVRNYFVGPYRAVSRAFDEDGDDKELPYLCLFQLGEFFNLAARLDEAFEVKKTVAEGLKNLLGERNPLSLKAEAAYAVEFLNQRRLREAETKFARLAKIQREVLGTDRPDCFQSLQRQGLAELLMTKYIEADMNLKESLSGFLNTVGVTDFLYLLSELSLGYVFEGQGEVISATSNFEHVWTYRLAKFGPDNPMTVAARSALTSSYRKAGRYNEAEVAAAEVIEARQRALGPESVPILDAYIQKIILYRDSGQPKEASKLIEFISERHLADPYFERVCQVEHIHALLEVDRGEFESARKILQALIDKSLEMGDKGINRSLLWVKLDLATILRTLGRADEALMLFDDLVTSIDGESSSSWEEPLAPVELRIAQKALRLVRAIKLQEARDLLEKNGLKWAREEDFWMLSGAPAADTGWMKSI